MKKNERAKQYSGEASRAGGQRTREPPLHDPYKPRAKKAGPAQCPQCFAVYEAGRWLPASTAPTSAEAALCPACQRIRDTCPAGEIHIEGAFALAHREDVLHLIQNCQAREGKEHPLSRIMAILDGKSEIVVTTTDIHLPRIIANALERAFKAQAKIHYDAEGYFIRVVWRRD